MAVSPTEARRIAVRAQLLDGSARGVLDTVRKLGFLQIDPISSIATPQTLVLWSRLGTYDTAELDRLLWTEKKLFEWGAFIWPIEDFPLIRARMRRRRGRTRSERMAIEVGFEPVATVAGFPAVRLPDTGAIRNIETVLEPVPTT